MLILHNQQRMTCLYSRYCTWKMFAVSRLPLLAYGTAYQPTLSLHSRRQLSRNS